MNTTLKKLSETLGFSISTVSRALKNHPDISDDTKKKVWDLANMMEYEPNTYAINLKTNNSRTFGLIVPVISNYFYDSLIASLEEEARNQHYSLLILQSGDNPEIEKANLKLCKHNRVTGLFAAITSETKDISNFIKLTENNCPVIFLDKVPTDENVHKICMADSSAAILAAEALCKKNRKKILAIFGNYKLSITKERMEAFKEYFNTHSPSTKLDIVEAKNPAEAYQHVIKKYPQKAKPDAIFCMSDEILTGVMKAIQQLEIKIPNELSLITISNGIIPHLYYPEITYVETSGYKMGKLAFSRMMSCLAGSSFIQNLKVESLLINGNSL